MSAPASIRSLVHRLVDAPELPVEGRMPGFDAATGWLNGGPLTPDGLRGRVLLVDFWTYTCINWLRTLPYLRAWHTKYEPHGLTIIGAHTPEFGFERIEDNVVPRAREFGVEFPIALDAEYGVWNAFANHYWPAVYVADDRGRIRYHHFGEGEYAMTEMVIQRLLIDAGATGFDPELAVVDPVGFEVAADWTTLRSPETYLGYGRASGLAAPADAVLDRPFDFPEPSALGLNLWSPVGRWTVAAHASVAHEAGGRIVFRFQARDVNLVMGPSSRGGRSHSVFASMARLREPPTAWTRTPTASASWPNSASTSSSDRPAKSTSGSSSSNSSRPAPKPTASHLGRGGCRCPLGTGTGRNGIRTRRAARQDVRASDHSSTGRARDLDLVSWRR